MYSQPTSQLDPSLQGNVQPQNQQQQMPYNGYQQTNMTGQTVMPQGYSDQQNPQMINQNMYAQQAPYPGQQTMVQGQPQPYAYGQPNPYGQMQQPVIIVQQPMINPQYNQYDQWDPYNRRYQRANTATVVPQSKHGLHPRSIECPHCKKVMTTKVKRESTSTQFLFCVILVCVLPPYCCIPFCLPGCYSHKHFCSSCEKNVD
ncbi:UNKNOWN [Stylonychia lemnae]|uniref:LITAF domain-containing protein n=1 Tax=Stylonychia lemnae TaxID=5949 RepID=A0A078A482_STYLE|nr:UNKNOWN [Stylonychia lemnae]|eukprot:CDW76962.1 UNKNOWN [Stylonychia lemnae]